MRLTERAHQIVKQVLKRGETAVDATAGNGHDTLFLAETVGPDGNVFAFDVQASAISETAARLEAANITWGTLICDTHAKLRELLPISLQGSVGVVMFNLGYLPGGDKSIITKTESTLLALTQAVELVRVDGAVLVMVYPGHAGGDEEADQVELWLEKLPADLYERQTFSVERAGAPRLYVVHKRCD